MKILILVALILQLVIIIKEADGVKWGFKTATGSKDKQSQYKFGDIIEFPRGAGLVPDYSHYAIYVGPVNKGGDNDVGQGDNDIFHRTREIQSNGLYCGFGKLDVTRGKSQDRVFNYLEKPGLLDTEDLKWVSTLTGRAIIASRINQLKNGENCGTYNLFKKNCEHLATYVRYGQCLSFQKGTVAGPLQQHLREKDNTRALEILKQLLKNHEHAKQWA